MILDPPVKLRVLTATLCADSPAARARLRKGFSIVELLVAIGIVAVLSGIILTVVNKSQSAAQSAKCLAHLRSVGAALLQNAHDHADVFPDPVALNQSWEQTLRPYIPESQAFQCPSDTEIYPAVGSSFDWRDTGVANTTLAGRTVHDTNRHTAVLAFECLPGWHGAGRINAALIDGSAQNMDQGTCLSDVQTPIR